MFPRRRRRRSRSRSDGRRRAEAPQRASAPRGSGGIPVGALRAGLLLVAVAAVFASGLPGGFVWLDHVEIEQAGYRVRDAADLGRLWTHTLEQYQERDTASSPSRGGYWRPLYALSFSADWLPVENGTDRQIVARRWLERDGALRIRGYDEPGAVWLRLGIPTAGERQEMEVAGTPDRPVHEPLPAPAAS